MVRERETVHIKIRRAYHVTDFLRSREYFEVNISLPRLVSFPFSCVYRVLFFLVVPPPDLHESPSPTTTKSVPPFFARWLLYRHLLPPSYPVPPSSSSVTVVVFGWPVPPRSHTVDDRTRSTRDTPLPLSDLDHFPSVWDLSVHPVPLPGPKMRRTPHSGPSQNSTPQVNVILSSIDETPLI